MADKGEERREAGPITDEALTKIRTRAAAASRGPWIVEGAGPVVRVESEHRYDLIADLCSPADARFIAAAREDVPVLIAEIYRLRAAVDVEAAERSSDADDAYNV